jgi:hypothetical protein
MEAPHLSKTAQKVFNVLEAVGAVGLTCSEVEKRLRLSHQTASSRLRVLAIARLVKSAGTTRKSKAGKPSTVWVVGDPGPAPMAVQAAPASLEALQAAAAPLWPFIRKVWVHAPGADTIPIPVSDGVNTHMVHLEHTALVSLLNLIGEP